MLFNSTVRKELARSFSASLVVLVTVVMTMMLIRVLSLANKGRVNPSDVLQVMGYFVLGQLPTILTLSLFIAIVSALSRMYNDNEMIIWFISGKGLAAFMKPIMQFSWPVLLSVLILSLFAWPWSNSQTQALRFQFETRGDLDRLSPGKFQESADGTRVFYIDKGSAENTQQSNSVQGQSKQNTASEQKNNIFIYENRHGKISVVTAKSGELQLRDGHQYLMLYQGQRLENIIATQESTLSEFEEYGHLVRQSVVEDYKRVPPKAQSTWNLVSESTSAQLGELAWRIGLFLAACNLLLLAVGATAPSGPRAGRGKNFIVALLVFIAYYNFLSVSQSWIASGKLPFLWTLVVLHVIILLLAYAWVAAKHMQWRPGRRQG